MKILLCSDGSEHARRAAEYLVSHLEWFKERPMVKVLTVHRPFPLPSAQRVVGKQAVESYQKEEAQKALEVCGEAFRKAGVEYDSSWRVGEPAQEILAHVKEHGIDLIVMGSHGHGKLYTIAMGSVASEVLRNAPVPVLFVR